MLKSKKFILIVTLAVLALVGGTTGAVLAATTSNGTDSQTETQAETQREALLQRIGEIYQQNTGTSIDLDQLQSAINQAQQELKEQALENRLQALVDNGTITQEEADQILAWWQSKPNVDLPGIMGFGFEGGILGGRGHHGWGGGPYCGDTSGDISGTTTNGTGA